MARAVKNYRILWTAAVALVAVFGLMWVSTSRAPRAQQSLNLVYLESNVGSVSGQNSIYGFRNDGHGHLTALPGSPYLTDGTGVYDPDGVSTAADADQEIMISADGTLLFAVNGGSDTVSVFEIHADGSLAPVSGSPFPSGGIDPASVGLVSNVLTGGRTGVVVVNKNNDPNQINDNPPNYTNFTTDSTGFLTPVTNGTINLPVGSSPAQAMVIPNSNLIVNLVIGSGLTTYALRTDGTMSAVASAGPPQTGQSMLGEWYSPNSKVIYSGIPMPAPDYVAVYQYSSLGAIKYVRSVPDSGMAICWMRTNNAGTALYTAESHTGTISVYGVSNALTPVFKQQLTVGGAPSNVALDPTQQFLYALNNQELDILPIDKFGKLHNTIPPVKLSLPTGEHPLGLATLMR